MQLDLNCTLCFLGLTRADISLGENLFNRRADDLFDRLSQHSTSFVEVGTWTD